MLRKKEKTIFYTQVQRMQRKAIKGTIWRTINKRKGGKI